MSQVLWPTLPTGAEKQDQAKASVSHRVWVGRILPIVPRPAPLLAPIAVHLGRAIQPVVLPLQRLPNAPAHWPLLRARPALHLAGLRSGREPQRVRSSAPGPALSPLLNRGCQIPRFRAE